MLVNLRESSTLTCIGEDSVPLNKKMNSNGQNGLKMLKIDGVSRLLESKGVTQRISKIGGIMSFALIIGGKH